MKTYAIVNEEDLVHYGVLGMKWGIRRYQPYSVRPRGSGKGGVEKIKKTSSNNVASGTYIINKYTSPKREMLKRSAVRGVHQGLAMTIPGYAMMYNVNQVRKAAKMMDSKDYTKRKGQQKR